MAKASETMQQKTLLAGAEATIHTKSSAT